MAKLSLFKLADISLKEWLEKEIREKEHKSPSKSLELQKWVDQEKKEKEHQKSLKDGVLTVDELIRDEKKEHKASSNIYRLI